MRRRVTLGSLTLEAALGPLALLLPLRLQLLVLRQPGPPDGVDEHDGLGEVELGAGLVGLGHRVGERAVDDEL
jgi:hypothetical protein